MSIIDIDPPGVLEQRALNCLRSYGFTNDTLTDEEMAAEVINAILPVTEAEYAVEVIWHAIVRDLGVCTNCMCTDCGCCWGCGGIDADVVRPNEHGSWCAL